MLKLNNDKTEVIMFSSRFKRTPLDTLSIRIGDANISPTSSVKNLGVTMDNNLTMTNHINSICQTSYINLRKINHIRKYINETATKELGLITS